MRIAVFAERLQPPWDEGIKNTAVHIIRALRQAHEVLALTAFGQDRPELGLRNVPSNPLLCSPWPAAALGRFRPELILYVPTACATLFSFWRGRMLKLYGRGAPVVLLALQVRRYGRLSRALMPHLRPELVWVQAERTRASLQALGCALQWLPPAVDCNRFAPVSPERRILLRRKYGLEPQAFIVLHVGHLNRGRNVQALMRLAGRPNQQVVVVGSASTPHDATLVAELRQAGVKVFANFLAEVAELYQLADCYVFPVEGENAAIDVPLSVLEAMACDLPVVTTPFGGLPGLFPEGPGMRYLADLASLPELVEAVRQCPQPGNRAAVAPYAWERVINEAVAEAWRRLRNPHA